MTTRKKSRGFLGAPGPEIAKSDCEEFVIPGQRMASESIHFDFPIPPTNEELAKLVTEIRRRNRG